MKMSNIGQKTQKPAHVLHTYITFSDEIVPKTINDFLVQANHAHIYCSAKWYEFDSLCFPFLNWCGELGSAKLQTTTEVCVVGLGCGHIQLHQISQPKHKGNL